MFVIIGYVVILGAVIGGFMMAGGHVGSLIQPVELIMDGTPLSQYGVCHSTCYPDAFWKPAGAFLEAVYDDYGQFKLAHNRLNLGNVLQFFQHLHRNSAIVLAGENTSHDHAFNFAEFTAAKTPHLQQFLTHQKDDGFELQVDLMWKEVEAAWEYMWGLAHEQRLFATEYAKQVRPLQFAVVHDAAFRHGIALHASAKTWGSQETLDQRSVFDRALTAANARAADSAEDSPDNAFMKNWSFQDEMRSSLDGIGTSRGLRYPNSTDFLSLLGKAYLAGTVTADHFFERIKPWLDQRYFFSTLEDLNLRLVPMVYSGQDYDNCIGKNYASFVTVVSKEVSAERRSRYGDDEDEDSDEGFEDSVFVSPDTSGTGTASVSN